MRRAFRLTDWLGLAAQERTEMETLIRAQRELWNDTIAIHMAERKPFGLFVAQAVTFTERPKDGFHDPFLRLQIEDAQRLMNELWDCGLRPSEGTGSAGSLKATEKHLTDMQRIAFMLLERPSAASGVRPLDCRVGHQTKGNRA
jgi:hypothetical protein